MRFEWSSSKAAENERKHGVAFEDAATVFDDVLSSTVADPDHSEGEERFLTFGVAVSGKALVVAHSEHGDTIRIISSREMTRPERRAYETTR